MTFDIDRVVDAPWDPHATWSGRSLGDAVIPEAVTKEDVEEVIFYWDEGAQEYDGKNVCVVRLTQGRGFAVWESWWGPTGSGFHEDAYGGDAIVFFAPTLPLALTTLSEDGLGIVYSMGHLDEACQAAYRLGGAQAVRAMLAMVDDQNQECCCDSEFWCRKHQGEPPTLPVSRSVEPEPPFLVKLAEWLLSGFKRG
jgi:hypothetical protein